MAKDIMRIPRPHPKVAGQAKGMTKPYDPLKGGDVKAVEGMKDLPGAVPKDLTTGAVPAYRRLQAQQMARKKVALDMSGMYSPEKEQP